MQRDKATGERVGRKKETPRPDPRAMPCVEVGKKGEPAKEAEEKRPVGGEENSRVDVSGHWSCRKQL